MGGVGHSSFLVNIWILGLLFTSTLHFRNYLRHHIYGLLDGVPAAARAIL